MIALSELASRARPNRNDNGIGKLWGEMKAPASPVSGETGAENGRQRN